jgi:hypothetical protein
LAGTEAPSTKAKTLADLGGRGIFVEGSGTYRYLGEFDPRTMIAHGYGAMEWNGNRSSGMWSDGVSHGHNVLRWADGDISYEMWECGKTVHSAWQYTKSGTFAFGGEQCDASDARFQELRTAALVVEVRPAPRLPHPNPPAEPVQSPTLSQAKSEAVVAEIEATPAHPPARRRRRSPPPPPPPRPPVPARANRTHHLLNGQARYG